METPIGLSTYLDSGHAWDLIIKWLGEWKASLPDLPELNFDYDPAKSCEIMCQADRRVWRRALQNEALWNEGVLPVLFPTGEALRAFAQRLAEYDDIPSRSLRNLLDDCIEKRYSAAASAGGA